MHEGYVPLLMALSPLGVEISVITGKKFLPIREEAEISTFNGDRALLIGGEVRWLSKSS
ncbi:MAG: hypothetical protein ABIX00_04150 [Polaromonas sp.]